MRNHGIVVSGFLQLDGSKLVSGGLGAPLFDGQYLLDVTATLDTAKAIGWRGGELFLDVQSHGGPNVATRQIGSIQDPDNMDAGGETSLDRVWFQQSFAGRQIQARLGLMYVDDQFLTVPYGGNFVSLDFSSDASISTFVLPTFPKGAWGADVFYRPTAWFSAGGGLFDGSGNTELPYNPGGRLAIGQIGVQGQIAGRPDSFEVGAWRHTGVFRRFAGGAAPLANGWYLVASQWLYQPPGGGASGNGRGLGAFLQYGMAPPAVAAISRHLGGGLAWTGPFAARPQDELGLAFSRGGLTPQDDFPHAAETEIEAYYQIRVAQRLTIQPDWEYWFHPGGRRTPNALLALVRVMYHF
ncbi:MAG: carbohydrate porin [Terriglobales bacterium]